MKFDHEYGITQIVLWKKKNLDYVKRQIGVSNINFKGLMANNARANRIAVINIYGEVTQVCQ